MQLSLYQRSVAWAVDRDHRLWMRRVSIGSDTTPVDPTDIKEPTCQKMVETTKNQVFLVDCMDNLYWRKGITDQMVIGESWIFMDDNVQWVAANDNGEIWVIRNDDELFVRTGVSAS